MEGIVLGFVCGVLLSICVVIILYEITDKFFISVLSGVFVTLVITLIGSYIGITRDVVEYNKKIANWNNTKYTLEAAIHDESLGDTARINLVSEAIEYNMQLTELKEDVKYWWYFYLDDDKVNELELIDIGR